MAGYESHYVKIEQQQILMLVISYPLVSEKVGLLEQYPI